MNLLTYKNFLDLTKGKYTFLTISKGFYEAVESLSSSGEKICFLRHDIDLSIENALRMAKIEAEQGIKSTYTVLLTGEFYNPFEDKNRKDLKEIISLGHEVGLHFDPVIHNITDENSLDNSIEAEKRALEDLLEKKVSMFSFHNTTDFSMSCRKKIYSKCLNAYSEFFHEKVEYISDSHGYWRFRDWNTLLEENHQIIQVLTHPIWWQPNNSLLPLETVVKYMMKRYKYQMNKYNQYFAGQEDRENISYLSEYLKENNIINDKDILNKYITDKEIMNLFLKEDFDESKFQKALDNFLKK
mgnify:CR=1 FL=1